MTQHMSHYSCSVHVYLSIHSSYPSIHSSYPSIHSSYLSIHLSIYPNYPSILSSSILIIYPSIHCQSSLFMTYLPTIYCTIQVWNSNDEDSKYTESWVYEGHGEEVNGLSIHPSGEFNANE